MNSKAEKDIRFMKMAIEEAKKASLIGEVPIGAVLVKDNKIVSSAHNMPIKLNDPSAHAEINVLRDAGEKIGNYRLNAVSYTHLTLPTTR